MKMSGRRILWPSNISQRESRREGRKLPKRLAIDQPALQEMFVAVQALGLQAELVPDKSKPEHPWTREGYVSVVSTLPKNEILKYVAAAIAEARVKKG